MKCKDISKTAMEEQNGKQKTPRNISQVQEEESTLPFTRHEKKHCIYVHKSDWTRKKIYPQN